MTDKFVVLFYMHTHTHCLKVHLTRNTVYRVYPPIALLLPPRSCTACCVQVHILYIYTHYCKYLYDIRRDARFVITPNVSDDCKLQRLLTMLERATISNIMCILNK